MINVFLCYLYVSCYYLYPKQWKMFLIFPLLVGYRHTNNGKIVYINYQLSLINYQLSPINYQLLSINYQLSPINFPLSKLFAF